MYVIIRRRIASLMVIALGAIVVCTTTSSTAFAGEPTEAAASEGAQAALRSFEASGLIKAPLRAKAVAHLKASPEEVWRYVSNHQNLAEYGATSGIKHASVDQSKAETPNGVGCKRVCLANEKDRFVEDIVYFKAPYAFAYSAVENTWGITDHVAFVVVRPRADGTTELEWRQYFNTAKPEMADMMAANMQKLIGGPLMGFFVKKYGGEVLPKG